MSAIRFQPAASPTIVPLSAIQTNGGTQPRAAFSDEVVADYAAAMAAGAEFPKIVVFFDGTEYWLADGFHRHAALVRNGVTEVAPDIRQGTRRDAILFSVGANASHGLRRTNEDKRRAIATLLQDAEWSTWSDRAIARRCSVSDFMVRSLRENRCEERTYVTKHGTTATMNTAAIGLATKPLPAQDSVLGEKEMQPLPTPVHSEPGDIARNPYHVEGDEVGTKFVPTSDDEITAADLENDPGFQKAVDALNNAKALQEAIDALPAAEPMTPEREARLERAFGTRENRAHISQILRAAELVQELPPPADMVAAVPSALHHAVDVPALLNVSQWFENFARAWERRKGASA
ncbi:ParB N-terminal domain-containing protein [Rhizobium sp. YJ-22]|uniref:ParB N-terminal domain-containing protein n=1 Tax=Rhizobium sp. YJ-22 TaxID=3037556 RepID=UPI002412E6DB|nr:ParB N-terminal domain-containing protein [Rhizobium sp. YJ-22]MDG3577152.1 ParB N-terminal domain-containing protein [Rhizobium sp. YJ-22]